MPTNLHHIVLQINSAFTNKVINNYLEGIVPWSLVFYIHNKLILYLKLTGPTLKFSKNPILVRLDDLEADPLICMYVLSTSTKLNISYSFTSKIFAGSSRIAVAINSSISMGVLQTSKSNVTSVC